MEKMCPSKTRSWSSISSYPSLHFSQAPFTCESIRGLVHGLDQDPPQASTNQRKGHWGRVQYLVKIQPGTGMMALRVRENAVQVRRAEFKYSRDWAWLCVPLVTETGGLLGLAGPSPTSRFSEEPWEGWQKVIGQHTRSPPLAIRHAHGHTHITCTI